ncbi:nicotinate-nucleotide--dimethylbenzimidazole phosphoribosyltransferase [Deltaproteobacteria bacterium TL4]
MNEQLKKIIESIQPVNQALQPEVEAHLNDLTKPPGSLGRLEDCVKQYCLARNTSKPQLKKKKIFTFAGDHGVADEGVSLFPKEVTPQMVANFLAGGAAINVFARHVGAEIGIVDMGVNADLEGMKGLYHKKIKKGTDNIAKGPAMTVAEAELAILTGAQLAQEAADNGVDLLGTGDMGIANTTPSSAILATLLPCAVEEITGRGTGIGDAALKNKIEVIKKALEVNKERLTDPLSVMAAVGGLEIAGICGLILGGASRKVPVVVDGFISSAGAMVACLINENVKDYLFFSHRSQEAGHTTFLNKFGVTPLLDLQMRLGEGTGAALAMSLIEASVKMYNEMATFSSAGVSNQD